MDDQYDLKDMEEIVNPPNKDYKNHYDNDKKQYHNTRLTPDLYIDLEVQIMKLKNSLEGWREIVLFLHSVILWEKNWYPAAIVGGTSFVFLSLWLLEPSVLTTVSILGLTITISDYVVPVVAAAVFKVDSWNGAKEKAFYQFCKAIIMCKAKVEASCASFYAMRTTRMKIYYGATIFVLALLAWIGNSFNNLFLTYVLLTLLLLWPGMEYHGVVQNYGNLLCQKVSDYTKRKTVQTKKEQ